MASMRGEFKLFTFRTVAITVLGVLLVGLVGAVVRLFLGNQIPATYGNVLTTVVLLGSSVVVIYVVDYALKLLEQTGSLTPHQKEVLYRFVQILTFGGVLLLIVIYVWDITLTNVILGAGVTSIVLALAARQTLSSILAGVIIISTDVFRVGDWVKIDNRFGQIEQISLFNTMVRSPQGETHVFPNDEITVRDITNLGKDRYRNDVLIGIDYDTEIDHAIAVCDSTLDELTSDATTHIDGFQPTTVKDFDESQITLAVKMWVDEPRPMVINKAQTTVFSELQQQFESEEITIPFPQRTLSDREPA